MAPFSGLLTDEEKIAKITPGTIIRAYSPVTNPPKYKYQLVCSIDPILVLLINSRIPKFIRDNSDFLKCQVTLKQEDYPFLSYNSHMNCVNAHDCYDISDLEERIIDDYAGFHKGCISANDAREIIAAVNSSRAISPLHKKIITTSLNSYLETLES